MIQTSKDLTITGCAQNPVKKLFPIDGFKDNHHTVIMIFHVTQKDTHTQDN